MDIIKIKLQSTLYILAFICIFIFVIIQIFGSKLESYATDKGKIERFSQTFSTNNIKSVDTYFNKKTRFIYAKKEKKYKQVRSNIIQVFKENKIKIIPTASILSKYIYRKNNFSRVTMILWVEVKGEGTKEVDIEVDVQKKGVFDWEITKIKSDSIIFEYLFFDNNIRLLN